MLKKKSKNYFDHLFFVSFICFFISFNFERDIARIVKDQELVSKRLKDLEGAGFSASKSPTEAKVGFAAIQEMARLQEDDVSTPPCDLSFLRFDPQSNRMTLEKQQQFPAKFPLEIPNTPVQSPQQNRMKMWTRFSFTFCSVLISFLSQVVSDGLSTFQEQRQ